VAAIIFHLPDSSPSWRDSPISEYRGMSLQFFV
jgi:hypothetical protein